MKRILILDNNDSFSHNLRHLLRMGGRHHVDVMPTREYSTEETLTYDALALSPGPGLPDDHENLKKAISDIAGKRPIWGICLGHQAIAEVYGMSLFNLPNVFHGIKSDVTITNRDGLWRGIERPMAVGRYHSWMVNDSFCPEEIVVSSRDSNERIMSFYHRDFPIYGVQFHPESFMSKQGVLLARNFIDKIN